jgi:fatty-acid desaturase
MEVGGEILDRMHVAKNGVQWWVVDNSMMSILFVQKQGIS